jgi:cation/acetate symporter
MLIAVAALAVAVAPLWSAGAPELLQWALALAASGSCAPLLLGLWWPRCNAIGALGGMVTGFVFTAIAFLSGEQSIPALVITGPWAELGAPAAAMMGLLISTAVTIGLSVATPASGTTMQTVISGDGSGPPPIRERPA